MNRRRMMMRRAGASPVLPAEYQRVEYIHHDAGISNYIDHVETYSNVYKIVLEFEVIYGVANKIVVAKTTSTFPIGVLNNDNSGITKPAQRAYDCYPMVNATGAIARNTYTFTKRSGATVPTSFTLFGWSNAYYVCALDVYGAKMYDVNDQLLFDAVPCYRKSDDVIGIYDTVEQRFFPVSGTWTKGADI